MIQQKCREETTNSEKPLEGGNKPWGVKISVENFKANRKSLNRQHCQQLSTQVLNTTTESKRAVKQLIRYLKGTQHTCLRLEPREMLQKGLLEWS